MAVLKAPLLWTLRDIFRGHLRSYLGGSEPHRLVRAAGVALAGALTRGVVKGCQPEVGPWRPAWGLGLHPPVGSGSRRGHGPQPLSSLRLHECWERFSFPLIEVC